MSWALWREVWCRALRAVWRRVDRRCEVHRVTTSTTTWFVCERLTTAAHVDSTTTARTARRRVESGWTRRCHGSHPDPPLRSSWTTVYTQHLSLKGLYTGSGAARYCTACRTAPDSVWKRQCVASNRTVRLCAGSGVKELLKAAQLLKARQTTRMSHRLVVCSSFNYPWENIGLPRHSHATTQPIHAVLTGSFTCSDITRNCCSWAARIVPWLEWRPWRRSRGVTEWFAGWGRCDSASCQSCCIRGGSDAAETAPSSTESTSHPAHVHDVCLSVASHVNACSGVATVQSILECQPKCIHRREQLQDV